MILIVTESFDATADNVCSWSPEYRKKCDQIVILDIGKIVETGNHISLIEKQGIYFNLVKNQLDLEKLNEIKMWQ